MSDPRRPSIDELADMPIDDTDVEVLRQTAAMFDELDPVPAGLVDRITFGLTLDALHAEVAELQRNADLVGVRTESDSAVQSITFTSSTLSAMITITPTTGDRARIDGWLAPGGPIIVELRGRTEHSRTIADEDGRFVLEDVPRGLAQLVLRPSHDLSVRPVVTPAIEI